MKSHVNRFVPEVGFIIAMTLGTLGLHSIRGPYLHNDMFNTLLFSFWAFSGLFYGPFYRHFKGKRIRAVVGFVFLTLNSTISFWLIPIVISYQFTTVDYMILAFISIQFLFPTLTCLFAFAIYLALRKLSKPEVPPQSN